VAYARASAKEAIFIVILLSLIILEISGLYVYDKAPYGCTRVKNSGVECEVAE